MAIDKKNLIEKINNIEGLMPEERSALLGLLRSHKKYGLVWEDKPENVEEHLQSELPVLIEDDKKAIISDNPDAPNHILIEGDNLEALTTLAYTHEGKIDVIYIDPPYNRGKKDFKYNDNYIDSDNPFRHSLWLCFMAKRLRIAKTLMSDSGVMILHIDEHEYNSLNLLLETEIFGASNNLGTIIWNKMNPKGDSTGVATMHEYIIIYAKNKATFLQSNNTLTREKPNAQAIIRKAKSIYSKLGKKAIPDEIMSAIKPFNYSKTVLKDFEVLYDLDLVNKEFQNWLANSSFGKGEKAYKYISPDGRVFRSVSMAWPNKEVAPEDYWVPLKHPISGKECPLPSKGWRNPTATMEKLLGKEEPYTVANLLIKGEIVFSTKKNGSLNIPERIYYLDENMSENIPSLYNDGSSDDALLKDLGIEFEYPKTVSVAMYLLKNVKPDANSVLDFFAGSGTTIHAVMNLNKELNRKIRCFLVTNNENNICQDITYKRVQNVIAGYLKNNGDKVEGLKSNSLRYYRTAFVDREPTQTNRRKLMELSTDMLCIKENLYDEQPKFGRIKLNPKGARYFEHGDNRMLIIYRPEFISFFVDEIGKMELNEPIKVYVYSPGRYAYDDEFSIVAEKVLLCALPEAILEAMVRILPKRVSKKTVEEAAPALVESESNNNDLFSNL